MTAELGSIIDWVEAPNTLEKLNTASLYGEFLYGDPATKIRHIAAKKFRPSYIAHQDINGEYGLQLLDAVTDSGVAVCGYTIDTADGRTICMVTHTPQGNLPKSMSRDERSRLITHPFRQELLTAVIGMCQRYQFTDIGVISAYNHVKVVSEQISLQRGLEIIDDVALQCGFAYGEQGNLWISL